MKSSEIRQKWLDFFESKQHKVEASASLVPHNDPSLLWINAGMAPLKTYFDGREVPENPRMTNAQKCIRTNDIENVGKTRRHQTFFEMLGNFSIGDYFKKEAIVWAWEFLTDKQWMGLDPKLLYVTVHPEDDEAYNIWEQEIGLSPDHIVKHEDNFWDIGEGPCGPCTEIFYDRGPEFESPDDEDRMPGGENERYLEIWNLVFSQFNHNKDGSRTPLPNKNIDTGAGLERFASVLQNVDSNFDTDLFKPIIDETCQLAQVQYKTDEQKDIALKVIADHARTVTFAIGDGVLPSNEGRGYVIRRLLRRAVRYGLLLGINEPFLYRLVRVVTKVMGDFYTEVRDKQSLIERVIKTEEQRFHETLSEGLAILSQMGEQALAGNKIISGEDAFKLYDTYGFPLDLTEDYAEEHGLTVDHAGFEVAMEAQRERARSARQESESMAIQGGPLAQYKTKSKFVGYNDLVTKAVVSAIIHQDEFVDEADVGSQCLVVLDRTPFYAESGGQVSDEGTFSSADEVFQARVLDVSRAPHGQHVHKIEISSGKLKVGDEIIASVSRSVRDNIVKNHTATHLLHSALKEALGEHVNQAGSLVAPDRLRFDFSHFNTIESEELKLIERRVNEQIWDNLPLEIEMKPLDEAKAMGAMALFGEKYGEIVRVVRIGDYSIELCGGCHVETTGQIGLFKIIGESGIGSGVRRIEAVTGKGASLFVDEQLGRLQYVASALKSTAQDVPQRVDGLLQQLRELGRENESLRSKLSHLEAGGLSEQVRVVNDIQVLTAQVEARSMDDLRTMVDQLKEKHPSIIIVLGAAPDGKVNLVSAVTPDLIKQGYHAGRLIKEVATHCGGNGGGRPDMAQAGGKSPELLGEALQLVDHLITQQGKA